MGNVNLRKKKICLFLFLGATLICFFIGIFYINKPVWYNKKYVSTSSKPILIFHEQGVVEFYDHSNKEAKFVADYYIKEENGCKFVQVVNGSTFKITNYNQLEVSTNKDVYTYVCKEAEEPVIRIFTIFGLLFLTSIYVFIDYLKSKNCLYKNKTKNDTTITNE